MQLKFGYGVAELGTIAKSLFSVALVVAFTLLILVNVRDSSSITAGSSTYNALDDIITEVIALVGWIGVVVLVMVASVLYGYSKFIGGGRQ